MRELPSQHRRRLLIEELERLTEEVGQRPSWQAMKVRGDYQPEVYDLAFGAYERAWEYTSGWEPPCDTHADRIRFAMEELGRLDPVVLDRPVDPELLVRFPLRWCDRYFEGFEEACRVARSVSEGDELVEIVDDIAGQSGDDGRFARWVDRGRYPPHTVREVYGTWRSALVDAGVIGHDEPFDPDERDIEVDVELIVRQYGPDVTARKLASRSLFTSEDMRLYRPVSEWRETVVERQNIGTETV